MKQDNPTTGEERGGGLAQVRTEAFERGVSVELRLGGTFIRWRQLSQVVQRVVKGRLGFVVVVFAGEQSAPSCQLSVVHPRRALYRERGKKTSVR